MFLKINHELPGGLKCVKCDNADSMIIDHIIIFHDTTAPGYRPAAVYNLECTNCRSLYHFQALPNVYDDTGAQVVGWRYIAGIRAQWVDHAGNRFDDPFGSNDI